MTIINPKPVQKFPLDFGREFLEKCPQCLKRFGIKKSASEFLGQIKCINCKFVFLTLDK